MTQTIQSLTYAQDAGNDSEQKKEPEFVKENSIQERGYQQESAEFSQNAAMDSEIAENDAYPKNEEKTDSPPDDGMNQRNLVIWDTNHAAITRAIHELIRKYERIPSKTEIAE